MRTASQALSEAQVPLPVPSRSSECTAGRPGLHKYPLLYQAQTQVLMPLPAAQPLGVQRAVLWGSRGCPADLTVQMSPGVPGCPVPLPPRCLLCLPGSPAGWNVNSACLEPVCQGWLVACVATWCQSSGRAPSRHTCAPFLHHPPTTVRGRAQG